MSHRHPLAIVGGAATLLAAIPLTTIYASFTWLVYATVAIAVIVGTAMAVRSARGPVWAQVLAMMAALLFYLTFLFPSGEEFARLIPTPGTFQHFNALFVEAGQHIRDEAIPVPDYDGLLLLTTAGIGLVAIAVDFFAVGIRRAALAGLPMLAIYSVPVAVLSDGVSVLTFAFAAAGYLWLLVADSVDRVRRFGRRFTGEGRDVDLWEPSPLASAGRRLGAVGVAIAMLLPIAVPGMTSGLLDRLGPRGGTGSGDGFGGSGGPSVDLFALLQGNLSQNEVFDMVQVTTNDPAPYYLRFGVADQITRAGFVNRAPATGTSVNRGLPEFQPPAFAGVSAQRYQAQVQILALDMQLAPVYQQVVDTQNLGGSWAFDPSTNQVFSRRSNINDASYGFEYVRVSYTPDALRQAPPLTSGQAAAMRDLMAVPQVQQVTELVTGLTAGKATQYDKVRAIYGHFSPTNGFTYSTRTELGTNGNAIVDFLEGRQGFCVQYAAAMAWLVRAIGIPARVAFGFTRGRNLARGQFTMTNLNLHAWTEVFFPEFGWVPFDATPAGPVAGSVSSSWAPDLTNPDPTPTPAESGATDPGGTPSGPAPRGPDEGADSPTGDGSGPTQINSLWLGGAAAATLLLALLLAPSLHRRALRRRRRPQSGEVIVLDTGGGAAPTTGLALVMDPAAVATARRDAHAAWEEMLDTMIDYQVPVDEAETPRATAERLGALPALDPSTRGHAGLLASAEERARYARAPLRPDGLDRSAQAIRTALTTRATRRQRLVATLLPPSVLLRWRTAWIGWLSRAVAAGGRVRESVSVLNPRRALAARRARTSP
jgi:transglutaminase-like putative cysteine protease